MPKRPLSTPDYAEALVNLLVRSKEAEEFIVYLLTHAPEMPHENGVVIRLREALRPFDGWPCHATKH